MSNIEVTISPAETPTAADDDAGTDGKARNLIETCDIQNLFELDDFEQFSAKASSGGSLYGVLRKQALLQALDSDSNSKGNPLLQQEFFKRSNFLSPPGPAYHHRHNRSKSLIHRKQTLTDDRNILKILYDYSENIKSGTGEPGQPGRNNVSPDIRRHSEATMNCRLFIQSGNVVSPQVMGEVAEDSVSARPMSEQATKRKSSRSDTRTSVPHAMFTNEPRRQTRLRSIQAASPSSTAAPGSYFQQTSSKVQPVSNISVCRRRSFSIKQNEIRNEGDEVLFVPILPSTSEIDVCEPAAPSGQSRRNSRSWKESSISRRSSANPVNFSISPQSGSPSPSSDVGQVNYATEAEETEKTNEVHNLYRVLMLGGPGVGKTALTQQFLTSEFMAAQNTSFDDCVQVTVPVLLDGISIFVEFIDLPYNGDTYQWKDFGDVDGYVIVYSIIDRRSFNKAVDILDQIKCYVSSAKKPVILVANKNDLERSRLIGKQEGRNAAESRDCKYIDVSAILNHKVDDLLVGVLKQMRDFRRFNHVRGRCPEGDTVERVLGKSSGDRLAEKMAGCFASSKHAPAPRNENLWTKLIRKKSWKRILSKSCENLL